MTEEPNRLLQQARSEIGKLNLRHCKEMHTISKLERSLRDLTRDRDHWKKRALEAEAKVASIGLVA